MIVSNHPARSARARAPHQHHRLSVPPVLTLPSRREPLPDDERYRRFGEELDAVKQRVTARVGAEDVALRPQAQPLLPRHGGRGARAHLLQPRAHHLPARRGRALGAQAAPGDRDRPHRAARRLRPPARRRGVRVEAVPLGHAHRRGVVATGPQRPPPRQHQRRRQGPRHRLRPGAPDRRRRPHEPSTAGSCRSRSAVIFPHFAPRHQHARHRAERGPSPTRAGRSHILPDRSSGEPPRGAGRRPSASTCLTTSTTTSSSRRWRGRCSGRCSSAT